MPDMRCGKRVPLRASVLLRNGNGLKSRGTIRNIGPQGVYLDTRCALLVESEVEIALLSGESSGDHFFSVVGLVAHRHDNGMGVMLPDGATHIISALYRQVG